MNGVLERVLYVEDDPDIRAVGALALDLGGIAVKSCASGHEAVAAAASFGPQLILLDVMMPGMDGPATLGALRSLDVTSRTPVVFMTAKIQPEQVERYREMGAVDVIPKPFDPLSLAALIRAIYLRAA